MHQRATSRPRTAARRDLTREDLLSLSEAARYLPTVNGKKHATSTLYRWCRRGIGGIRLEYIRVGRTIATSREALDRFFAALAEVDEFGVRDPKAGQA
jgi:hypothetical protein